MSKCLMMNRKTFDKMAAEIAKLGVTTKEAANSFKMFGAALSGIQVQISELLPDNSIYESFDTTHTAQPLFNPADLSLATSSTNTPAPTPATPQEPAPCTEQTRPATGQKAPRDLE